MKDILWIEITDMEEEHQAVQALVMENRQDPEVVAQQFVEGQKN